MAVQQHSTTVPNRQTVFPNTNTSLLVSPQVFQKMQSASNNYILNPNVTNQFKSIIDKLATNPALTIKWQQKDHFSLCPKITAHWKTAINSTWTREVLMTEIFIFRAEVAIDRFVVNNREKDPSAGEVNFRQVSGLQDHVETRAWALLGTLESGVKTVVAAVAALVASIANNLIPDWGANHMIYKDVMATQFDSFWRCALAVYSPNKALDSTLDENKNWVIAKDTQKWGTSYDAEKTTLVEKCYAWTIPT